MLHFCFFGRAAWNAQVAGNAAVLGLHGQRAEKTGKLFCGSAIMLNFVLKFGTP